MAAYLTADDLKADLIQVRAAITRILLAGQSSGFAGHNTQRANLSELQKRESRLLSMLARMDGSDITLDDFNCGSSEASEWGDS